MTFREKIFLTIILAQVVALFSYSRVEIETYFEPAERSARFIDLKGHDTTLEYLQDRYKNFNEAYFDNKLPADVKIDMNEVNPLFIGSTLCTSNNVDCTIHFNLHYVASPRYADLTLLHEMCHIPTYEEKVSGLSGQEALHGPLWRTCMLKADIAGANRYILIDGYEGKK